MKVNYTVGNGNVILSWQQVPFNERLPWVEVDDPNTIHIGFDRIENGVLVPDQAGYEAHAAEVRVRVEKLGEVSRLKGQLAATDYQAIKHSEGLISEVDYAEIKAQRQAWRDRINELEEELAA